MVCPPWTQHFTPARLCVGSPPRPLQPLGGEEAATLASSSSGPVEVMSLLPAVTIYLDLTKGKWAAALVVASGDTCCWQYIKNLGIMFL